MTPTPASRAPQPRASRELLVLTLLAWVAFAAIPVVLGGIGLSWDALNHHIYLGWTAFHPRFDRDFLAASYQSYQYPYLYWPFYAMAQAGFDGRVAGAILASLVVPVVPALWLVARNFIPERSAYGLLMRWVAVALAMASGVVLSMFDTTANDLLAAVPMVWSVALALEAWSADRGLSLEQIALRSGLCAGVAVAFKLSNGPLAVLLPVLWAWRGPGAWPRLRRAAIGCAALLAGFLLLYGPWGWQLWQHFGNPIYPFNEPQAAMLRHWLGVTR